MWGRAILLGALWAMAVPGGARAQDAPTASPTGQPPAKFRSAVDLVSVAAVVRDRKGRFVSDLSREDFTVVEAGLARPIVGFRAEDDGPVKVAVLFDVSGSMRVGSKAVDAREAARQIFSTLRSTDQAALFSFDTRLDQVHGFTSDYATLERSLDRVNPPYGQTSLYDAVAETARAVAAAAGKGGDLPQRAAVIVITDGVDTNSRLTPAQVSGIASGIDVPVYVVAVMSFLDDPRTLEGSPTAETGGLQDLARWTGGDLFLAMAPAHANVAARQIVGELRHQYLLAFEASPRPGWKSLEVRARGRDLVVRARSGYTAGGRPSLEAEGR